MNELSLFTGAGGGLLGTMLLGFRPIGYVEWDDYCQRVIAARIRDGILPNAPIFGDIRTFIDSGSASLYRGVTDIITAGFPCQPFSVAGKQKGADDERNMWPATAECIRIVRPSFALLENVPGLLSSGYFGTILSDIYESGFDARWALFSAKNEGAPIERKRLFIACTNKIDGKEGLGNQQDRAQKVQRDVTGQCPEFWLQTPSFDIGMGNGVADYVDRVGAIGNAQCPQVVATAWRILTKGVLP